MQTLYAFLILFYTSAYGTAQVPEIVFYNYQVYGFYAKGTNELPLENYYRYRNDLAHIQIKPDAITTGNAWGYIGRWEDGKLKMLS